MHCCQQRNRYAHASTKVCLPVIASNWLLTAEVQKKTILSRHTVAALIKTNRITPAAKNGNAEFSAAIQRIKKSLEE